MSYLPCSVVFIADAVHFTSLIFFISSMSSSFLNIWNVDIIAASMFLSANSNIFVNSGSVLMSFPLFPHRGSYFPSFCMFGDF